MITFIYNLWVSLLESDAQIINGKKYYLHHKSCYSRYGMVHHGNDVVFGYSDSFDSYSLKKPEKINNLYKLLLNSKHIFLRYRGGDFTVGIYHKKYGWITYYYCDDCLDIHIYDLSVIYELNNVYRVNEEFSLLLRSLKKIELEKGTIKNIDFS